MLLAAFAIWAYKDAHFLNTTPLTSLPLAGSKSLKLDGNPFSLESLHNRLPKSGLDRVSANIQYFSGRQQGRMTRGLARSNRYMTQYRSIFQQQGIPVELTYLPLIESGFMETAVSPAQAVGMWQFIASTGKIFNLHANQWSDSRRDPIKSAHAAARYLKQLHKRFDNWELALAAYNAGARTVQTSIRRNKREGKPTDFWHLDLPQETQNYVPAFLAAVIISKNPPAYGLNIRFEPQLQFDIIQTGPGIPLGPLAKVLDISLKTLRELNPQLLQDTVPPKSLPENESYSLRIPKGKTPYLLKKLNAEYQSSWVLHYDNSKTEFPINQFVVLSSQ